MTRKNTFFEGWSWFEFNNLGLALGMALEFYTSVAKGLKLNVRKFSGLIPKLQGKTDNKSFECDSDEVTVRCYSSSHLGTTRHI